MLIVNYLLHLEEFKGSVFTKFCQHVHFSGAKFFRCLKCVQCEEHVTFVCEVFASLPDFVCRQKIFIFVESNESK